MEDSVDPGNFGDYAQGEDCPEGFNCKNDRTKYKYHYLPFVSTAGDKARSEGCPVGFDCKNSTTKAKSKANAGDYAQGEDCDPKTHNCMNGNTELPEAEACDPKKFQCKNTAGAKAKSIAKAKAKVGDYALGEDCDPESHNCMNGRTESPEAEACDPKKFQCKNTV